MIILYNILLLTGAVAGFPVLLVSLLISRKLRKTARHRLGLSPFPKAILPPRPIWVHALSVGEVIAALPLLNKLKTTLSDQSIVLSVSTLKGYEVATQKNQDQVDAIFYFPYDFIFPVRRMISKINPSLVLIVETDIWPNFLFEMKRRNIPVILVNARFSDKSVSGYLRFLYFMKPVLRCFTRVCVQTEADIRRFSRLGISPEKITWTGNIKFEQSPGAFTVQKENDMRFELKLRSEDKVFLAGSTHPGEEAIILDAYSRMKDECPHLVLIVAPRDPGRAQRICGDFQTAGHVSICKTELESETDRSKQYDVIVVDTIGVLSHLYAVADVTFVGGSLVNSGGHNPLEPAAFGKPILFGPDMSDFREISKRLLESEGAIQVRDSNSLYRSTKTLLNDPKAASKMGKSAYDLLCANRGAVENTLGVIREVVR